MNAPSVRRRFGAAISTLERNLYYISGRAADPNSFQLTKPENAGAMRNNLTERINHFTNLIHTHVMDSTINKVLTGDYAPKPGGTDIAKAVLPRLPPYATMLFKNPLYMGGALALCGAAMMLNHNIRHNIIQNLDRTSIVISKSSDELINHVITGVQPDIPPNLKIMPIYKPLKT